MINDYRNILEKTKINDIVSITVYCIYGNYFIEKTYYSILFDVKYFDIDEFYAQDEEEVEEEFLAPSKAQIKKFQDDLKQRLLANPNFILCSNKNLRQSFMRETIDEMADEMKMDNNTAYYSRDFLLWK
ncbi:hypothetical protein BSK66_10060 [Paenibacillus odorifer]|uniref:Uncharacterized protein n=1 Tax=Paenibacillus odorifer TaxID=189426 RepID=A0A1R0XDQ2_9BACL|nr:MULTISPECIES: hypothetical protein [Paenibacillus]ETT45434.1 hypothetical protein C171_32096 [Paenibacillus sp. FSL H8-237]OMD33205.1 hypothetical protein BJP51_12645 [Paenibacillus odorifer]OME59684.1 hypothetical protein BSK66_10060 [Paenibacillus odorifer]